MQQLDLFPALIRETTKSGAQRTLLLWHGRRIIFEGHGQLQLMYEQLRGSKRRKLTYWDLRDEFGLMIHPLSVPYVLLEAAISGRPYDKYYPGFEAAEQRRFNPYRIDHIFCGEFLPTHYLVGTTQKRPIQVHIDGDQWYYRNQYDEGRAFPQRYVPLEKFTEAII